MPSPRPPTPPTSKPRPRPRVPASIASRGLLVSARIAAWRHPPVSLVKRGTDVAQQLSGPGHFTGLARRDTAAQRAAQQYHPAGRHFIVLLQHPQCDQPAKTVRHEVKGACFLCRRILPQPGSVPIEPVPGRGISIVATGQAHCPEFSGQAAHHPGADPKAVNQYDFLFQSHLLTIP